MSGPAAGRKRQAAGGTEAPPRRRPSRGPKPRAAAGSAALRGRAERLKAEPGALANRTRRSPRRGRKRRGLVPDAAAAAAICHHNFGPGLVQAPPSPRPPRRPGPASGLRGGCFPAPPSLLCARQASSRMDLVGVSSPEPGPAAAWGPNKVSGARAIAPALVRWAGPGEAGEGCGAGVGGGGDGPGCQTRDLSPGAPCAPFVGGARLDAVTFADSPLGLVFPGPVSQPDHTRTPTGRYQPAGTLPGSFLL